MSKKSIIIISIVAVILLIIAIFAGSYNSLVNLETKVHEQSSNVDTTLQRRADLIPNLISTVKGYMKHEESVISKVTEARQKLLNASGTKAQSEANEELTSALNGLMVVVENYPDLKASKNFTQLMDELSGTENRITVARRDYNSAVTSYNRKIRSFPTNILAGMFGFEKKDLFEASANATQVSQVNFD